MHSALTAYMQVCSRAEFQKRHILNSTFFHLAGVEGSGIHVKHQQTVPECALSQKDSEIRFGLKYDVTVIYSWDSKMCWEAS